MSTKPSAWLWSAVHEAQSRLTGPRIVVNHRILIVDDTRSIHEDFRKILERSDGSARRDLGAMEDSLFGSTTPSISDVEIPEYCIDSAFQGEEALQMVRAAHEAGAPYAVVFMDIRMPPGWDGVETIARIWQEFPFVETVICTAYSDHSWEDILKRLGHTDRLLFLSKPFDATAVKQMALTLTRKWNLDAAVRAQLRTLENDINTRRAQHETLQNEITRKDHALRNAELVSQTKSAFLANMSHEIRTPLTAILGFAETLLDGGQDNTERQQSIATIIRNAKHLQHIVNDILDLSKIEAGMLQIDHMATAPGEILRDVESVIRPQAQELGLTFTMRVAAAMPTTVITDALRLRQVLLNLCSNAVKFTPTGHITMEAAFDASTQRLAFSVSDTGIGMTEAQLARVFQPFAQADASITRRFGGTGLGLSICAQLVELLGGKLRAQSTPGVGSKFVFDVPVKLLDSHAAKDVSVAPLSPTPVAPTPGSTLRGHVLLVEDVVDNQKLISLFLRRMGVSCDIAENGAVGVERALSAHYDVIFMDIEMPVLDGLSATRQLRARHYTGPIVALTANAMKEDREQARAAGFDEFLSKPIDRAVMHAALSKFLKAPLAQS